MSSLVHTLIVVGLGPAARASSTAMASSSPTTPVRTSSFSRPSSHSRCHSTETTLTHRSPTDHRIFEQSTADIWTALSKSCRRILQSSKIPPSAIKGIGFDATCSLAVVDRSGQPVSVSRTGASEEDERDENLGKEGQWNVVLWADHRAEEEAETINATGEGVLGFVGNTMSVSGLGRGLRRVD